MSNAQPPRQLRLNQTVQTVRELQLPGPGIHVIEMVPALVGGIIQQGTAGIVTMIGAQVTVEFAIQGNRTADLRGNLLRSPSNRVKLSVKMSDFEDIFRIPTTRMK